MDCLKNICINTLHKGDSNVLTTTTTTTTTTIMPEMLENPVTTYFHTLGCCSRLFQEMIITIITHEQTKNSLEQYNTYIHNVLAEKNPPVHQDTEFANLPSAYLEMSL
jgi:hypothetical protein